MRIRFALALVLSLFAAVRALPAQERVDGASVRVTVTTASDALKDVRGVVESSIQVYLEREGIVLASSNEASEAIDFVLIGSVSQDGSGVEVTLVLKAEGASAELARAASVERVGMTLDRQIATLTAALMDKARTTIAHAATARRELAASAAKAVDGPVVVSDATPDANAANGIDTRTDEPAPITQPSVAVSPAPDRIVAVGSDLSPFMPIAGAADYFRLNVGASISLDLLPFASDLAGFGVFTRAMTGRAQGASTSADLVIVAFGATSSLSGSGVFVPYARLSAGAAVITATNETLGSFSEVVPYAAAGLGIRVTLFGPVAIQAAIAFESLFESSVLVFGFAPGIGIVVVL